MLRLCESSNRFSNFESEISNLISRGKNISRQLNGWLESLKNSKITGARYLTQKDRDNIAYEKQFEEFDLKMASFRREHEETLLRSEEEAMMKKTVEEGS